MNKSDDSLAPSTNSAPRVRSVWRRSLRIHPDAERMHGVLDAASPAVQIEIEKLRAGDSGPLPMVAKVPEQSRYVILTEAAALAASKALGHVAPKVHIVTCTSMAHALTRMIELNQAQPKSALDVLMEVYFCYRAQKELSKERQRSGGGDHRSVAAKRPKGKGTVPAEPAGTDQGETRDIVAKITQRSRADVGLMIGLAEKALEENPETPRQTRVGRALAHPDADLKAIAREFGVLKERRANRRSSDEEGASVDDATGTARGGASNDSTRTTATVTRETGPATTKPSTSGAASSDGQTPTTKNSPKPESATAKALIALVDNLISLADNVDVIAACPVAGPARPAPEVASVMPGPFTHPTLPNK